MFTAVVLYMLDTSMLSTGHLFPMIKLGTSASSSLSSSSEAEDDDDFSESADKQTHYCSEQEECCNYSNSTEA